VLHTGSNGDFLRGGAVLPLRAAVSHRAGGLRRESRGAVSHIVERNRKSAPQLLPTWRDRPLALELYAAIIGGTTGQAADQLRDQPGLESPLGRSRDYAHYQEADLALQAAALAHGIAESQAFIDGNERLALPERPRASRNSERQGEALLQLGNVVSSEG
jgi:hypothetical protein